MHSLSPVTANKFLSISAHVNKCEFGIWLKVCSVISEIVLPVSTRNFVGKSLIRAFMSGLFCVSKMGLIKAVSEFRQPSLNSSASLKNYFPCSMTDLPHDSAVRRNQVVEGVVLGYRAESL